MYPRGSEWRRWDLHIHAPSTILNNNYRHKADGQPDWDAFAHAVEQSGLAVVGVTDYFGIEGYKELRQMQLQGRLKGITLLPNVEFRINRIVQKRGSGDERRLSLHVIFSETLDPALIEEEFLRRLKFFYEASPQTPEHTRALTQNNLRDLGEKLKQENATLRDRGSSLQVGAEKAVVDDAEITELLSRDPRFRGKYLMVLADEYLGEIEWGGAAHVIRQGLLQKADMVFSGNPKTREFCLGRPPYTQGTEAFVREFKSLKACVHGSDAHDLLHVGHPCSRRGEQGHVCSRESGECILRKCWIKADPTFLGLVHASLRPSDRVWIGEEPTKLLDEGMYPSRFMDRISIFLQTDALVPNSEKWFDVDLALNSGLVAVIGNKGSGKSALADVLALVGNAHCDDFSFLNEKRFRQKPNRSLHFTSTVYWHDGSTISRSLADRCDRTQPERVKYLGQQRIEELCNEIIAEGRYALFEQELRTVVFSHVPVDAQLGAADLDQLIDKRSAGLVAEMDEARVSIMSVNRHIVELEGRTSAESLARLEAAAAQKQDELAKFDLSRPVEVPEPSAVPDEAGRLAAQETASVSATLQELEARVTALTAERQKLNTKYAALSSILDRIGALEQTVLRVQRETALDFERAGLDFEEVVQVRLDRRRVEQLKEATLSALEQIAASLGSELTSGLLREVAVSKSKLLEVQQRLNAPMRARQVYLAQIADWQQKRGAIVGSVTTPGTLEHLRNQKEYLSVQAPADLASAREERWQLARTLIALIERQANVKRDLYTPVQAFIDSQDFDHSRLKLEFAVTSSATSFGSELLDIISQSRSGTFMGNDEGRKLLEGMVAAHDFKTTEDVCSFLEEILAALTRTKDDKPRRIEDQLKKGKSTTDVYDLLFKLEWLRPHYALQLDGKSITLLSPGEKGALLIVFYLLLDPSKTPLVIDQPEHNLDNESIMTLLVPCFQEASRHRQVIVVTHNPNLAVVADADQVVHASIHKKDGYRIDYKSGALESPTINGLAVNVLEGTLPAFEQRGEVWDIGHG